MVTLYGAGDRTGILNVEGKLAKALGKQEGTLVIKASERDAVLNEISARIARYDKFDPETADELRLLRVNVKDIFNKGQIPGDEIMEQLYFLDNKTKDVLNKMTQFYDKTVTPDDFKQIAKIMSEHLREQVPVLRNFTKFFGRLAEDFLVNAKPKESAFDWKSIAKVAFFGGKRRGYTLSPLASQILGVKANEALSEKFLKRFGAWEPNGTLHSLLYGVKDPKTRRTGAKYFKLEISYPTINWKKKALGAEKKFTEYELLYANKMPKAWTNVPSVNFDGKVLEQNYTQVFEERLLYQNKEGKWINNILQVPQKTEATWWEQLINKDGKINDIANPVKARTAYGVNLNHSNDAVLVKKYHLWGRDNNIATSTIHDRNVLCINPVNCWEHLLWSISSQAARVILLKVQRLEYTACY